MYTVLLLALTLTFQPHNYNTKCKVIPYTKCSQIEKLIQDSKSVSLYAMSHVVKRQTNQHTQVNTSSESAKVITI